MQWSIFKSSDDSAKTMDSEKDQWLALDLMIYLRLSKIYSDLENKGYLMFSKYNQGYRKCLEIA